MNKTYAAAIASIVLIGAAIGSPITRVIRTQEQLKAINATVQCKVHRFSDDDQLASFTVTWKPEKRPGGFTPSLIFAVFKERGIRGPECGRMRVVFEPGRDGLIRAEFDVAVDELSRSQIIFMTPQIWADTLVLRTAADGFPEVPKEIDPFEQSDEDNRVPVTD